MKTSIRFISKILITAPSCLFASLLHGQSTPLTRELQREANTAYAQDVADQANARAAASQQVEEVATDKSYAPLEQRLRNSSPGFAAYSDRRFSKEPGKQHYYSGSRDTKLVPWTAAERVQMLAKFQDDYDALSVADRAQWENTGSGPRPPTPKFTGTSLTTSGLGGPGLPQRTPSPSTAPSGNWLTRQINSDDHGKPESGGQAAAVAKYPALAVSGSPLNREFVARVASHRAETPELFQDPSWPMKIADESVAALASGTTISR